ASAFRLALLTRLVGRLFPGDAPARVNRLVAGLDDVASASPATALEQLAEEVRGDSAARQLLARPATEGAGACVDGQAPPLLAGRVAAFLAAFGHRAVAEGELMAATWRDDPTPVFEALRTLAASRRPPGFGRRARADVRRAEEEALLARLGPLRRRLMRQALAGAQRWVRERERTKSVAVALVDHGRRLARAAARPLVTRGLLRREEDVFFLELPELLAALEDAGLPAAELERRRRRFEREGALPAPRAVGLAGRAAAEAAARG